MQVISKGAIFHRTQLLEAGPAERFARCLAANPLFDAVTVEESKTAKSERKFFVRFQPASGGRQIALIQAQEQLREQRAQEQASQYLFVLDDSNRYFHCLNLESGQVYETTERSCSCPDHQYRGEAVGPCKHIRLLRSRRAQVRGWN